MKKTGLQAAVTPKSEDSKAASSDHCHYWLISDDQLFHVWNVVTFDGLFELFLHVCWQLKTPKYSVCNVTDPHI